VLRRYNRSEARLLVASRRRGLAIAVQQPFQ
jgi:hypothetical protein